jgi:drug/metabolite transporter (DMT)-like permease
VPLDAFVLALTAAVVHAGWNLLTARSPSSVATSAVALPLGALACLPLAVAAWDVDGAVAPYAVASVALEVGYITLLGTAYDRAPLTVVYPAARGLAVVLVLAVSVGLLGVSLPAGAVAGVLAVAAGVVLVRGERGRGIGLAVGVAGCIAGYTLVDHAALDHAAPLPYLELKLGPTALIALAIAAARVGRRQLAAAVDVNALLVGLGVFAAYGLVLAALARAPAAPVAAVRESSILIAAAFAAATSSERVPLRRWAGAAAVAAGVAAIALA